LIKILSSLLHTIRVGVHQCVGAACMADSIYIARAMPESAACVRIKGQ